MKSFLKGLGTSFMITGLLVVMGSVGVTYTTPTWVVVMNVTLGFGGIILGHKLFVFSGGRPIFVEYRGYRRY